MPERSKGSFLELPTVSDECWISREDASLLLGVSSTRIGWLITAGTLIPARNAQGGEGLDKSSVDKERAWRQSASPAAKAWRLLRDGLLSWL